MNYKIFILVISIVCIQLACKKSYNTEELKKKAVMVVAEKLGEDSTNISISKWEKVGDYEGDSYVGSFYKNKADQPKGDLFLGLFEVTKGGKFNLISLNPYILNQFDNTQDKDRRYDIISDYKHMNGFCLSNGMSNYYFVVRTQEDAREVIFCEGFKRELYDKKGMQVCEYINSDYDHISFEYFVDYTLPSLTEGNRNVMDIPDVLSNENRFFLISPNYDTEDFNILIEHYQKGRDKEEVILTKIELLESSYKDIKLRFEGEDKSKNQNVI